MTTENTLAILQLSRTENIGPITFYRLVDRYGSAQNALNALPDLAKRGGRKNPLKAFDKGKAEDEIATVEKYGATFITYQDPDYPELLARLDDAPPIITVMGNSSLLSKPSLGIVGARNASLAGRKIAETFSQEVGEAGYLTVSGLARGIDSAVHTATLGTGTIAVVAGGIDVIYPSENKNLYQQITETGAVVAESPFSTQPIARHFPKRNRIISGLSLGVLVVEAAIKSGSLITARQALEQNREVFAVPGSPLDARASGTNMLIRDGNAHITTEAADILDVLKSLQTYGLRDSPAKPWNSSSGLSDVPQDIPGPENTRIRILENLSPTPVDIDALVRAVEAPTAHVLTILLELEIAGRIERHTGNRVNLV